MKLYHGNMIDGTSFIDDCDETNINTLMNQVLDKINFKSYYSRRWQEAPGIDVVDYGSHTEYFYIVY